MKRFYVVMSLVTVMVASLSAKAQEVTFLLRPGWNWIGYPYPESVDLENAFGDFEPMTDDVIESFWGYSEYVAGYGWFGGIDELRPGWGYMYYSNRTEAVSIVFSHPSTPVGSVTVTTSEPMLITAISAMGGGEVTVSDGTYILVKGLCWATHENPTTNDDFYQEAESGVGSFSISMTGFNIATTYYVRAYAVTPNGTVYGDQKAFTTRDGIPTVTTDTVTNITGVTASCGGTVTDNGGLNVTARGVCWGTSPNPTIDDSHTTNGSGMGSFSSSITGLSLSTTYYVRAYASTSQGTGYGEEVCFNTRDGIPEVNTASVTGICGTFATCGGTVTDNGGLDVINRGVCWSTNHNPTITDNHTTNGSGLGNFTSSMTGLVLNTTYHVRAYASTSHATVYGEEMSFTTLEAEHIYVDLGLPSGLLWATCNVGADIPEDYGDYLAWGETQPKETYNWSTYQYSNGSSAELTKYCNNYSTYFGYNGYIDDLTTLLPEDDVATVNWGTDWRMPTQMEWQELYQNTTCTWTTRNGVNGCLCSASNGNSLFLPAAGGLNGNPDFSGTVALYWSSSLCLNYQLDAMAFYFDPEYGYGVFALDDRSFGYSVRAVRCKNSVVNVTANLIEGGVVSGGGSYMDHTNCTVSAIASEDYIFTNWTENGEEVSTDANYTFMVSGNVANFTCKYVDLGLPSGTLWATCNVGADSPENCGDKFAWGETQPKDIYNWSTYQLCMGSEFTLTKYCYDSSFGYNGYTDNLTALQPEDDAATANLGNNWRMPTAGEWYELSQNTTCVWTTRNGVNGLLFTASNGNSLFLPYGAAWEAYWSNSLFEGEFPSMAYFYYIVHSVSDGDGIYGSYEGRQNGLLVRPVRSSTQN